MSGFGPPAGTPPRYHPTNVGQVDSHPTRHLHNASSRPRLEQTHLGIYSQPSLPFPLVSPARVPRWDSRASHRFLSAPCCTQTRPRPSCTTPSGATRCTVSRTIQRHQDGEHSVACAPELEPPADRGRLASQGPRGHEAVLEVSRRHVQELRRRDQGARGRPVARGAPHPGRRGRRTRVLTRRAGRAVLPDPAWTRHD